VVPELTLLCCTQVYKGLNIATGELFALKEIEIHTSPNADQVTQMQKLGEEISLMNNLSHKHIVRSVANLLLV
jgi:serine/threonine protein kinase